MYDCSLCDGEHSFYSEVACSLKCVLSVLNTNGRVFNYRGVKSMLVKCLMTAPFVTVSIAFCIRHVVFRVLSGCEYVCTEHWHTITGNKNNELKNIGLIIIIIINIYI